MNQGNTKFRTTRLSEAAYLMSIKGLLCTEIREEEPGSTRMLFCFDISVEDGERSVLEFYSSESAKFDNAVKVLKTKIHRGVKKV